MKKYIKIAFIFQNVKYLLSDTYFSPNSIKSESLIVSKLTKKEVSLNLNLSWPSEVKSLAFLVSLC